MVGSVICDKTEHKYRTCTSRTKDAIIGRKYRSFCIGEKVTKPEVACADILDEADRIFEMVRTKDNVERHPTYKTDDCGIDDECEKRAMWRANLLSNGAKDYDPLYDHKIESRLRTIPCKEGISEQFIWEEKTFMR